MHEKLYRTEGRKPVEELQRVLAEARLRHFTFDVSLANPPFERDGGDRITAIRLRFTPRPADIAAGR